MEAVTPEIIALFIAFLTLLGSQMGGLFLILPRLNEQNKRIDDQGKRIDDQSKRIDVLNNDMNRRFDTMQNEMSLRFGDVDRRFDTMNQRFDETTLLIGELRDRTGKLEGRLDGFLAGRRDRDAA